MLKTVKNIIQKKKTIKGIKCLANSKGSDSTCYNHSNVVKMANDWNTYLEHNYFQGGKDKHPGSKKEKFKIKNIEKKDTKTLWNILNYINTQFFNCHNEYCWSNLPYIKGKSSLLSRFIPRKPRIWLKDNNTWLNTNDIENVLYQYEKRFPEFKFLGVSPIDYDYQYYGNCVSEDICNLNIKKQFNDKKKYLIGIVFNLDRHNEPGSHWVAVFADLKKKEVYYYDSYGLRPPYEIRVLMNKISQMGNFIPNVDTNKSKTGECLDNCHLGSNVFKSYYNNVRHQYKNSECGVYSMHFIISFLEGQTFDQIINNIKTDDEINKYRDIYYHDFRC